MPGVYDVRPFSSTDDTTFAESLSDPNQYPTDKVKAHSQAGYLYGYAKDLGAATIVVEHAYTDGDYLEDYAAYYSSCFPDYARRCKRVHLFSIAFDRAQFEMFVRRQPVAGIGMEDFTSSYLGFIVVRPLPVALIGRTLLKTYDKVKTNPDGERDYLTLVEHPVYLYGVRLTVKSLSFQEQDTAVAACATVALWSAFHKTAELFHTPIPRPPRITRDATRGVISGRPMPSSGLTLEQMAEAVRENGLDPEVISLGQKALQAPLVSYISSYLAMGLPVILGIDIETHGLHAVTLTGVSRLNAKAIPQEIAPTIAGNPNLQVPTTALHVDEFYAHDDGVGPFSRLTIVAPTGDIPADGERQATNSLHFTGGWMRRDDPAQKAKMWPFVVVVPVYRKIRLSFTHIYQRVLVLHFLSVQAAMGGNVDWDISLTTTNAYKDTVWNKALPDAARFELLTTPQPRFIWRAAIRVNDVEVVELLADATGFNLSFPFFAAHYFDVAFGQRLAQMLQVNSGIVTLLAPELRDFLISQYTNRIV